MNTHTQYMSVNITLSPQEQFLLAHHVHVDMVKLWDKNDHDLNVTIIQKTQTLGSFGLTPNVITQTSHKVDMTFRFLGLVGSVPLEEH